MPVSELEVCLSVTLHIVDLWQHYVCCTRSGVTLCTLFMVPLTIDRACACYTRCCDRTSVHLCASSQYCMTFILLSVSQWNDLGNHEITGVGLVGFKNRANAFLWTSCSLPLCVLLFSLSHLSFYGLGLWGWGGSSD